LPDVKSLLVQHGIPVTGDALLEKVIGLVKDRCNLMSDFVQQASFFFKAPGQWDLDAVKPKWSEEKYNFFEALCLEFSAIPDWQSAFIEDAFKKQAVVCNIKPGELQLPFRIMMVGGKFGPPVFDIAELIGKEETIIRIKTFKTLISAISANSC
jgi:glutamyl-tRNA synthetase